jgi:hypothetical protein
MEIFCLSIYEDLKIVVLFPARHLGPLRRVRVVHVHLPPVDHLPVTGSNLTED